MLDFETCGARTRYPATFLVTPGDALTVRLIHQLSRVPDEAARQLLRALTTCIECIALGQADVEAVVAGKTRWTT
ncbi:hypothetical protein [Burkholderia pyrrocinia]|uniref:hypothetical protein n=1 Tax=Burkholderia pyrrocinia TaxID=60550 RepID=UPI001BCE22DF|nr:hypothetical protein [Burkholderia pyrrocinia]QVN20959.1 hypothetical protein JYG32_30940 [Burkholderia pyrrocinia]